MYTVLVIIQVLVAIALVTFVLLQQGKGADAGAAFGAGASGTVFGSRGTANFFSRATAICAVLFMSISLALAYLVHDAATDPGSIADRIEQEESAPAEPDEPAVPTIPE